METSKLQDALQKSIMPIANKVEQQKHLQAIKDGMIAINTYYAEHAVFRRGKRFGRHCGKALRIQPDGLQGPFTAEKDRPCQAEREPDIIRRAFVSGRLGGVPIHCPQPAGVYAGSPAAAYPMCKNPYAGRTRRRHVSSPTSFTYPRRFFWKSSGEDC